MMMGPACFALLSSPGFGFGFKELQKSGKNLGRQMACNRGSPQLQFLWGGERGGEDLHLGGGQVEGLFSWQPGGRFLVSPFGGPFRGWSSNTPGTSPPPGFQTFIFFCLGLWGVEFVGTRHVKPARKRTSRSTYVSLSSTKVRTRTEEGRRRKGWSISSTM